MILKYVLYINSIILYKYYINIKYYVNNSIILYKYKQYFEQFFRLYITNSRSNNSWQFLRIKKKNTFIIN